MIGTINTPLGGTSLGFRNNPRLSPVTSTGKVHFRSHKGCDALLQDHATSKRRSSLYDVLCVKGNATHSEIKTAYRNLAKIYHPDASDLKQDGRNFIEINNAYTTLNNPDERAIYDMQLNTGLGQRLGSCTTGGKYRSAYTFRRWETDQCW